MSEQRANPRWLSCLKGQLQARGQSVDCLIRDFSSEGARIEVPSSAGLPDHVEFYFPLKQATFRARVRWRRQNEIGIAFEAPDTDTPSDPIQAQLVQAVHKLEAENAQLRLECTQLRSQLEGIIGGDLTLR